MKHSNILTSPEKILYPEADITKEDLVNYYSLVFPFMEDFVRNRPLALVRCPSGRHSKCFFQKHLSEGAAKNLPRINLKEKHDEAEYVFIRRLEDLISLVQLNVLELHAWSARQDRPDRPDVVVFDLDPGEEVGWDQTLEAAFELKAVLDRLELVSFVKTTGGKGLHVLVPIERKSSWEEVKDFSLAVAKLLVKKQPTKYVAESRKNLRKGKVFIDYLRNVRGASSIVLFSTRAKKGAPISMPLKWEELDEKVLPMNFNVKSMMKNFSKPSNHAWRNYFKLRQVLKKTHFEKILA